MVYLTPTLTTALTALGRRLDDPTNMRWTHAEKTRYINEALRTWNAFTQEVRDEGVFATTAGQAFVDLPTVLPVLRGYSVTNWDLITDIEYTLLEPPTPTAWTGTEQFTLADVWQAIQRRRDQFLVETGIVLHRSVLPISPPPNGRITIPERILTLRRCAWIDLDSIVWPLLRTEEWGMNSYRQNWVQNPSRPPEVYSTSVTPPLSVQLCPPPFDTGQFDLVSVDRGAILDPAVQTPIGVPDDWTWVIKFGALADLWGRDGLALDAPRAQYAEARWQQGIQAAKAASVVLAARINNVVVQTNSLSEADTYSPLWQTVLGQPSQILLAGHNLLAFWPPPDLPIPSGQYGVTLDVVRNMPIPATGADALQVGADTYDAILDYAQHLALVKEGSGQIVAAQGLLDRFARYCGVTIDIQQASQPARAALMSQTNQDENALARELPVVTGG